MRKTKIICTIGPASESEEMVRALCLAGMNVARLNFSHGTHEEHQVKIDLIKKVREALNLPIPIMLDTKGPEYRIGTFENHKILLNDGDTFTFTADDCVGDEKQDRGTGNCKSEPCTTWGVDHFDGMIAGSYRDTDSAKILRTFDL